MSARRRTAVSYSRFSDPSQAGGDSADRQERMYRDFCQRHNLTPGKEVFADRGLSGYHDTHRKKGRLGDLVAAAKAGRFDPGTVVVIEAWDRLGRLRPDRQTELVSELLKTGVSIGVCRLNDIFSDEDFGNHKWTILSTFIMLAHQESKQKAERVGASWAARRERARKSGAMLGCRPPAWIELANGEPRLIPERAAVVKRIYKLAADGMGQARIVRTLTEEKVRPFGEKAVSPGRVRSQFSGRWSRSYVGLLLRDRRTVGEFQPMKADRPDGSPLPNYYPSAVTDSEFALARAGQEQRKDRDKLNRRYGPKDSKYVNVFKGMLTHARDGEGFSLHNKGTRDRPELLLITASGNEGRSATTYTFPYLIFEEHVLGLLREIDPKSILPRDAGGPSTADTLRAELANCREQIGQLKGEIAKGFSKTLVELLRKAEADEERVANELQDELARIAKPLSRTWRDVPTLIDVIRKADDPDLARLKLRPALRAIVESAHVLIASRGAWQLAAVQFVFVGGATRHNLILYRPAANRRPVTADAMTFAAATADGLDLRKPADVVKATAALEKIADELKNEAREAHAKRKREAARQAYAASKKQKPRA